jgi:type I pantothenate kinase
VQPDGRTGLAVSDFFDFSVYVDARIEDIRRWYVDRFFRLRETAFTDPHSYFHRYAALSDDEARATAEHIWATINEPNLTENVRPTRGRASLVMSKGEDHGVRRVRLRKL